VKHHDYDSIQLYRSSRVSESRVLNGIKGDCRVASLLAMKPKQFLEVPKRHEMFQKDYILRMIEQLGKFLAKVIINKNAGNYEEAKINS
jgi:hypothetical protein